MKIAILGTRGIPNYYGGFEQFAEFFSIYLVEKGYEVYCYNSHNHNYQEKTFHGVNLIHKNDPEYKYGTFGQFIYDYNCIIDSRKRDFRRDGHTDKGHRLRLEPCTAASEWLFDDYCEYACKVGFRRCRDESAGRADRFRMGDA